LSAITAVLRVAGVRIKGRDVTATGVHDYDTASSSSDVATVLSLDVWRCSDGTATGFHG
jgi:hypothetical protein